MKAVVVSIIRWCGVRLPGGLPPPSCHGQGPNRFHPRAGFRSLCRSLGRAAMLCESLARHRSRDPSNPPATPTPGKSKGSALDLTLTGSGFAVGSGSSRPERMRARAATSRWSPSTSTARCPPCHEPPRCLAQLHHCVACARVGCKITLVQVARK